MTDRAYTGIGSRETPPEAYMVLQSIGSALAQAGYTLRSGAADGADRAFERGAQEAGGAAEIYLPWRGFNGHPSTLAAISPAAFALAQTVHPTWTFLGAGLRKLHARNCYQVMGADLATPSDFLICWTADGCESERARTKKTDGTATAIVLAERNGVPVFNLRHDAARIRLVDFLAERGVVVEVPLQDVPEVAPQPNLS